MAAVAYWGRALIEDPDRVGVTGAIGVDETKYLAANATVPAIADSPQCRSSEFPR
jgi:hypothetical protein